MNRTTKHNNFITLVRTVALLIRVDVTEFMANQFCDRPAKGLLRLRTCEGGRATIHPESTQRTDDG